MLLLMTKMGHTEIRWGQMSGELTDSTQFRASSRAVSAYVAEIGTLNHSGECPSAAPESAIVDALADALLQVQSSDCK